MQVPPDKLSPEAERALLEAIKIFSRRGRLVREARERAERERRARKRMSRPCRVSARKIYCQRGIKNDRKKLPLDGIERQRHGNGFADCTFPFLLSRVRRAVSSEARR